MAFSIARSLLKTGLRRTLPFQQMRFFPGYPVKELIGEREIVGHGQNSQCIYIDNPAFPFPAIRFREPTCEILALREKEKGDWRNLSVHEKKELYRASFCQTYAEFQTSTGQWKSTIGFALIWLSVGIWVFLIQKKIWSVELPDTFAEDRKYAQLKRMLALEVNPVNGLSSKWDYAQEKWK